MRHVIFIRLFIVFALILGLSSCSSPLSEEEILAKSTRLLESGEASTAEILLREYLATNSDSDAVKMLLGSAYAASGKYLDADYQYVRINIPLDDLAVEKYLEALYLLGDIDRLIDIHQSYIGKDANADISGLIYALSISRKERSFSELSKISKLAEADDIKESLTAQLILITNAFANDDDVVTYVKELDRLRQTFPDYETNWIFLHTASNFYYSNQDYDEAIALYKQMEALRPNYYAPKLSIANALVRTEQWEEAELRVNDILAKSSEHPIGNQLNAFIQINKENLEGAKSAIENALSAGFETRSNYLLAGDINFSLNNYEQAINFLQRGLQGIPGNTNYHNMLIFARAAAGDDSDDLLAANRQTIDDLSSLNNISALIGGLRERGNEASIQSIISSLKIDDSADPLIKLEASLLLSTNGNIGSGRQALESSKQLLQAHVAGEGLFDKRQLHIAKNLVIGDMVARQQFDEAFAVIDLWLETEDQDLRNAIYTAEVYKAQGRHEDIVELLTPAVSNIDIAHGFTLLAISHNELGEIDKAKETIEAGLLKYNYNVPLLRQYVSHELRTNARDESFILGLYSDNQQNLLHAISRNIYFAMHNEFEKAKAALIAFNIDEDKTYIYWNTLVETELRLNNRDAALSALRRASEMRVLSYEQVVQTNNVYERINSPEDHITFLEKHIDSFPANDELFFALAKLYIDNGRASDADTLLETREQISAEYFILRANARLNTGDIDAANADFITAFNTYKTENSALAYADFLNKLGEQENAIALLDNYYADNPNAINTLLFSASLQTGEKAVSRYKEALRLVPNNIFSLNNITSELIELGRYQEATEYAERALKISPDNVEIKSMLERANDALQR